jgi:hypothetical protein
MDDNAHRPFAASTAAAGRVLLACTELPLAAGPPQTACIDASEALGNLPRAFAHLALIGGALKLDRALGRVR